MMSVVGEFVSGYHAVQWLQCCGRV